MKNKRETDAVTQSQFRTHRFSEINGHWFFYTREKTTEGPFVGMLDARIQLDRYIKLQKSGLLPGEDKFSLAHY